LPSGLLAYWLIGLSPPAFDINLKHKEITMSLSLIKLKQKDKGFLCGPNENCFEKGEHWGHLKGVMCKFLADKGKPTTQFFCTKRQAYVKFDNMYSTYKKHKN
jgi:hypothetical protein